MNETETWSQWFRQNFDKILLFVAWIIALCFCLHMMHDHQDLSNVAWGREGAGTVLGAFLGLVTGSRLAAHSNSFQSAIPADAKIVRTVDATSKETTEVTAPPKE